MRLTTILLALGAAHAVTALPKAVRTDSVTTAKDNDVVSSLTGLTAPVGLSVGKNHESKTTTTTTHRKVRRVFSSSPPPPMTVERLAALSFAAAQGEGKQAEGVVFNAAKQADHDLGLKKLDTPQQAAQPPNVPGQEPRTATVAGGPSLGNNVADTRS